MNLGRDTHQKPAQRAGLGPPDRGEASRQRPSGGTRTARTAEERSGTEHLMEEVLEKQNVLAAIARVRANKGSPGIDGMTVDELWDHLVGNWPAIAVRLLDGSYEPKAVKM
jgi:RNA-directed DNA polymerase